MAKYKRRRKKNSVLLIGIAVIAILIFISTGYALWSDTLYINGTANTKYKEPKLDSITVNKSGEHYFTFDNDDSAAENLWAFKIVSSSVNNGDEKIEAIVNYDRRNWNVTKRTLRVSMSFINNYPTTITNGTATLLQNTTKYSIRNELTPTILANGTGTFTVLFDLESNSNLSSGTIQYKFSYKVDEVTRYFYVTINITN